MGAINIVIINGEEKELDELPIEEQERLAALWNRKSAEAVNYVEVKTA